MRLHLLWLKKLQLKLSVFKYVILKMIFPFCSYSCFHPGHFHELLVLGGCHFCNLQRCGLKIYTSDTVRQMYLLCLTFTVWLSGHLALVFRPLKLYIAMVMFTLYAYFSTFNAGHTNFQSFKVLRSLKFLFD